MQAGASGQQPDDEHVVVLAVARYMSQRMPPPHMIDGPVFVNPRIYRYEPFRPPFVGERDTAQTEALALALGATVCPNAVAQGRCELPGGGVSVAFGEPSVDGDTAVVQVMLKWVSGSEIALGALQGSPPGVLMESYELTLVRRQGGVWRVTEKRLLGAI